VAHVMTRSGVEPSYLEFKLLPQQVRDKVKPSLIVCVVVIHGGHCRLAMLFPAMQWHRLQAVKKDGADNFRWRSCNLPGSRQAARC
jgi:hypothetical protein